MKKLTKTQAILFATFSISIIWSIVALLMYLLAISLGPETFWLRILVILPVVLTAIILSEAAIKFAITHEDNSNNSNPDLQ